MNLLIDIVQLKFKYLAQHMEFFLKNFDKFLHSFSNYILNRKQNEN